MGHKLLVEAIAEKRCDAVETVNLIIVRACIENSDILSPRPAFRTTVGVETTLTYGIDEPLTSQPEPTVIRQQARGFAP